MALLKNAASRAKAREFNLLTTGTVAGLAVGSAVGFGLLLVPFFMTTVSRSAR